MNIQNLVNMANDMSNFFNSAAGEADAPREIASFITRHWDPRMRSQLIEHGKSGGEGLYPATAAAVKLLVPPGPRPA
jgi:formate dehydrogenase subunit delta